MFLLQCQTCRPEPIGTSVHGAGFSIAPFLRQAAWFRFHNRAEVLKTFIWLALERIPELVFPVCCALQRLSIASFPRLVLNKAIWMRLKIMLLWKGLPSRRWSDE